LQWFPHKIHQRFFKAFGATFLQPEKMANVMESTHQKTFTQLGAQLSVAAALILIMLVYTAFSAYGQYIGVRVTDVDTMKFKNKGETSILSLEGTEAPETSKKKLGVVNH
jgi:hypothetical protein